MDVDNCILGAQEYLQSGKAHLAIDILQTLVKQQPKNFDVWKLLGFAYHEEQYEADACYAFANAIKLNDQDISVAMAHAQSCFFSGTSAIEPFKQVMELDATDLNAVRGYALALAAEQQTNSATSILDVTLKQHPGWFAGHKLLASQLYTVGEKDNFAFSYARACHSQKENLNLRMEWFRTVVQIKNWQQATKIIEDGIKIFGRHPQLLLAELFIASESGDDVAAVKLFNETHQYDDVVRDMALVRFCLKKGDIRIAEQTALRRIQTPNANVFWPYLSLIWRLTNNPLAEWLDGSSAFVSSIDLDIDNDELTTLSTLLRKLHFAKAPFTEQSVRGGTQTNQNLFLRKEPIIAKLKARVQQAVSGYVKKLPEEIPGHPLLGMSRESALSGRVHFSGSWSVRLASQGFNVSHTHPMGWISSALYISLPEKKDMGKDPAGWIQFGTPPPELNLSLKANVKIQPKVGRLVLFPSTMWHSTVPFDSGERLVVAFDVRAPR